MKKSVLFLAFACGFASLPADARMTLDKPKNSHVTLAAFYLMDDLTEKDNVLVYIGVDAVSNSCPDFLQCYVYSPNGTRHTMWLAPEDNPPETFYQFPANFNGVEVGKIFMYRVAKNTPLGAAILNDSGVTFAAETIFDGFNDCQLLYQ